MPDVTNLEAAPEGVVALTGLVRLKPEISSGDETAKIVHSLTDVDGGVLLDKPLGGFYCWNIADLIDA